jgi:CubicO group peptidase (beta-lactamase class C family)
LDYAQEKLFDPLGIDTRPAWQGWDSGSAKSGFTRPGFGWATDRDGINVGAAGLKLTSADMVKIGELYVSGGRWDGRQIVSEEWVKESTSPKLTPKQLEGDGAGFIQEWQAEAQYGYLWWVGEINGHPEFMAPGLFYQRIFCLPDLGLVVVVTADDAGGSDNLTLDPVFDEVIFDPVTQ